MKNLICILLSTITILISSHLSVAQISEGGTPPSFTNAGLATKRAKQPLLIYIDSDVNQLKQEDAINEANGVPPRLAKIIPVNLSIDNAGEWFTLSNGQRIWQLTVKAPNAIATLLYYNEFYIPKNGKLFIYNQDKTQVLGAYTSITNPNGKEFASEFVAGDVFTLEYVEPTNSNMNDKPRISLSGIGYGYNHLQTSADNLKSFGTSAPCMVNINCTEGDNWQDEKKGVARTIIAIGSSAYACSGTLLNNTANDYTPYFLTAHHCFYDKNNFYAGTSGLNQMIFYFNYEHPNCENSNIEPVSKTMVGAQMLVDTDIQGSSDGVLIKLNQNIPTDYNTYYNGWDISNNAPQNGVCIHHPGGDVKKISTYTQPATSSTWQSSDAVGALNAHWKILFAKTENGYGITQGGSSGSPLFNQAKLVVGTLTGGGSSCSSPQNADYYGKLWYHWDQVSGNNKQMKPYLDPLNTEQTRLQGTYLTANVDFIAETTIIYASESIQFVSRSYGSDTYNWSFPGAEQTSSVEKNPIICYNKPGIYDVSLTINKGQKNEQTKTIKNYINVKLKIGPCPTYVEIGAGTQTSQFPLGLQQQQSFSSSIYTADELGNQAGTITELSWYANNDLDKERTIIVYMAETDETEFQPALWSDVINGLFSAFKSTNSWTSTQGWNTVKLHIPFKYSGKKNLKITIQSSASSTNASDLSSTQCHYSIANNKHMQWVSSASILPYTKGTVNSNRPNIKVAFDEGCVTPPVANFTPMENIIMFKENFDKSDYFCFPPPEWQVNTSPNSFSSWISNNTTPSFNVIDPTNISSAVFLTSNYFMDSWLISPSIDISLSDSKLEFYCFYDTKYISASQVNLYISTDDGVNWTQKWTTGNVSDNNNIAAWYKQTVNLSEYTGQKIKIGWHYIGTFGTSAAIDNVTIYAPNVTGIANIYEGDVVTYNDESTGPIVTWDWSFEGGSPANSSEQNPAITYFNAGVYKTSLNVKNNLGTDSKTMEGAVVVKVRTPVANFKAENGYTRQTNHGRFIPVGGSVAFGGNSLYYPRAWKWQLKGAEPSSATTKLIDATYSEKGKYTVHFEATNSAGTSSIEKTDYVLVGDSDWIWNMPDNDSGTSIITNGNDYWAGSNTSKYEAFCERFDTPMSYGEIKEIKILFDVKNNDIGNLVISIYNEINGLPGDIIASVNLPVTEINKTDYTVISLPDAVAITNEFYIAVSGFGSTAASFKGAIKSSALRENNNTAYAYNNGKWVPFSLMSSRTVLLQRNHLSLNIVPKFTYTDGLEVAPISINCPSIDNTEHTLSVVTNISWKASTSSSWVTINNGKGTGDGSFSIKCSENIGNSRTATIVVEGGGLNKTITITQYGTIPSNLNATLTNSIENKVQLNWTPVLTGDNVSEVKYNIYRNNTLIGQTPNNSYIDETAKNIGNNICYYVIAIFKNGTQSLSSNTACVFINVPVKSVLLTPEKVDMTVGDTYNLIATILPDNASNKTIKRWESSNPYIAEVNNKGVVTAKNYGTTTIMVTTNDGEYTASSTVISNTIPQGGIKPTEGFSPNSDGVNDYFIIQRIDEYPDNELAVFDRNGTIHYQTKSYNNTWNGVANQGPYVGQKLPSGTYYYNLKIKGKPNIKSFVVIKY